MTPNRKGRPGQVHGDRKDIRRVVNSPDGRQFEVAGTAEDWKLGTGSVVLDVAAFLWALVRQARGKEWVVVVRHVGTKSGPILTRTVRTREEAVSAVSELADSVESGHLAPTIE